LRGNCFWARRVVSTGRARVAEHSQTVFAATQQQAASMQEISASSQAMTTLADGLKKGFYFKI
jgi:methyl-accepting chemotaxis protein